MQESGMRGIDHVGVVVPDIEVATRFFVDGLGGQVIYQSIGMDEPPLGSGDPSDDDNPQETNHNLAPGTRMHAQRMIKLANGPDIELFVFTAPTQAAPARGSDFGLTHIAIWVDDIDAAVERFEAAGGTMLSGPMDLGFRHEAGEGNRYCYGLAPWGMAIELIALPGEMGYESETDLRRWQREQRLS